MPNVSSNSTLYATLSARYPAINIPNATASNTYTLLITAATTSTLITDVLFRNKSSATVDFEFIISATGSQATAENSRVYITVQANAGNSGSAAIGSLAVLVPSLFDIDLAGNRVITLEAGQSLYVKNPNLLIAAVFVTVKARDY